MGKNKAVAGLILSIVALVFGFISGGVLWFLALLALPLAIVGLVLAVKGGKALKAEGQPSGLATAALVLGIIAVVWGAISFISCGVCGLCLVIAGAAA